MASGGLQLGSGSDGDLRYVKFDERKRKRMLLNCEAARRSRMRKKQHFVELISEVNQLQNLIELMRQKINEDTSILSDYVSINSIWRAENSEYNNQNCLLNSNQHLEVVANGHSRDIIEVPDALPDSLLDDLLEPWQHPYPSQHKLPPAIMFHP